MSYKTIRLKIDAINQLTEVLINTSLFSNDYLKDALKEGRIAKAYTGKILGELRELSPYKNDGKRETAKDIEQETNVAENPLATLEINIEVFDSYIKKIDTLRECIKFILDDIHQYNNIGTLQSFKMRIYTGCLIQYLNNTRFYLGFELGRIKNNNG